MKRSALLVLSSLLLTSASYAGNTKCDECYDLSTKNAAALHYTTSKPNSRETKYWDDFLDSGQKDITVYVRDLSRKDAQAALWFITTGGKHGFAAREATAQERICLEDAIKHVAISYSQQGVKSGRGLQEWSQVSNANHAGHLHLHMIYKKIDDLKDEVNTLKSDVILLKKAKEEGFAEITRLREEANQAKVDSDNKFNNVIQLLKDEAEARTKSAENFTQTIKDQMDRLPTLMKPMIDEIKDMAKQSETKWTTIWDDLKKEKTKVQQEANKQKGRKRHYKKQLAEYKVKEAAAEKAKAVADALKEHQEAAAERERQREEEVRKEREAAAKEREMFLQEIAALKAIQANVQTGIGSPTANNNTSSLPFGTRQRSQGAQETCQYDYDFHATVTETAKVDRTATQNR